MSRSYPGYAEAVAPFTVHFVLNDRGTPEGKLADAELHFAAGPLDGLKLDAFAAHEAVAEGGAL